MKSEQLIEVIKTMRIEILDKLLNTDLLNEEQANRALATINDMFKRLDLDIDDVIPQDILFSYFGGVDEGSKALVDAGIDPKYGVSASISSGGEVTSAFATHVHMQAVAELTDNTMMDLKAAIRTARNSANKAIGNVLDSVKSDIQSGIISGNPRKEITKRVAESFAKQGMHAFTTINGKSLPLDFYSQVVTRTNMKMANTQGVINRYQENDVELIKITGNTPTCEECAPYRDIVFSLTGETEGFTQLGADETPPFHPNCHCSVIAYVDQYKDGIEINKEK